MKLVLSVLVCIYLVAVIYIYLTQDSRVFNPRGIGQKEPIDLPNTQKISFEVDKDVILDGVYKKSQTKDAPLIIYFDGNADDATRILLHVKSFNEYDIVAFNYRGFVNSGGIPSEKNIFDDALRIFDKYGKNKEVILMGRSLGTGIATYLASKRDIKGLILITPYDSIISIAKRMYPIFPVEILLKHKFESVKYIVNVKAKIGLIEVENDETIPKYHFDKLKDKVPNLALHVKLKDITHGNVFHHIKFEESIRKIIERF